MADTTISGSMCFLRLSISPKLAPSPARLLEPAKLPQLPRKRARTNSAAATACLKAAKQALKPDEECGLKLDDEVRLTNEGQGYFHRARSLAFQLQPDVVIHYPCKTALKKLHLVYHRFIGPNLCRATGEAHVIGLLFQRAIQAGGTDFQSVAWPRNQFLNVEDNAQLFADSLTIRMRSEEHK